MTASNFLRFRLDGVEYTLRGEKSPEIMEDIVRQVDEKLQDIRKQAPFYSQTRAITLAALQLSEELLELKAEYNAFLTEAGMEAK